MILLIPILFISGFCNSQFLLNWLIEISQGPHQWCLNNAPKESNWLPLYKAIVCGARIEEQGLLDSFQATGLIHLMVVSGAHLLLLEGILKKGLCKFDRKGVLGRIGSGLIFGTLVYYCLMCQWRPPSVRALLSLIVLQWARSMKLNWPSSQSCMFTGLILLSLFPAWWSSISLILSWTAALVLGMLPYNGLKKNLGIYVALFPILHSLSPTHPLSVLVNWMIGPLLGIWLYPASLLSFLIPPLYQVVDVSWGALVTVLNQLQTILPAPTRGDWVQLHWLWWYLGALHLLALARLKLKNKIKVKEKEKEKEKEKDRIKSHSKKANSKIAPAPSDQENSYEN